MHVVCCFCRLGEQTFYLDYCLSLSTLFLEYINNLSVKEAAKLLRIPERTLSFNIATGETGELSIFNVKGW